MIWLYISGGIVLLVVLFFLFLRHTRICEGGELFKGCGKIIYPWSRKIKLPSGRYCCIECYARDLKLFAESTKGADDFLVFTEAEEEFDLGE